MNTETDGDFLSAAGGQKAASSSFAVRPADEAEIDARLAKLTGRADGHALAGGTGKRTAAAIVILSLVGMYAALSLIIAEKTKLKSPGASLTCDLNPLIGCGKWIGTRVNEVVFGISNPVLGLAGFAALAAFGVALLGGACLHRNIWRLLAAGACAAAVWVCWFMYQSFFVAHSLCPYCVLTWYISVPLILLLWARCLQAGHCGARFVRGGEFLVRNYPVILTAAYAALSAFILFYFWDKWMLLF